MGIVDSLGVHESARRRGIGRALMAAAETWLREHGASDVEMTPGAGLKQMLGHVLEVFTKDRITL